MFTLQSSQAKRLSLFCLHFSFSLGRLLTSLVVDMQSTMQSCIFKEGYSSVPNNCAANLINFLKKSNLHTLIFSYTFINFSKNFLPTCLLRRTNVSNFRNILSNLVKSMTSNSQFLPKHSVKMVTIIIHSKSKYFVYFTSSKWYESFCLTCTIIIIQGIFLPTQLLLPTLLLIFDKMPTYTFFPTYMIIRDTRVFIHFT